MSAAVQPKPGTWRRCLQWVTILTAAAFLLAGPAAVWADPVGQVYLDASNLICDPSQQRLTAPNAAPSCLNLYRGDVSEGALVASYPCTVPPAVNDVWRLTANQGTGSYVVASLLTGFCIDTFNTAEGELTEYQCDSTPTQQLYLETVGNLTCGQLSWPWQRVHVGSATGDCLTLQSNLNLTTSPCSVGALDPNQVFSLPSAGQRLTAIGAIFSEGVLATCSPSGYVAPAAECLNTNGANTAIGPAVIGSQCQTPFSPSQEGWYVAVDPTGTIATIISLGAHTCADTYQSVLVLNTCGNAAAVTQQWVLEPVKNITCSSETRPVVRLHQGSASGQCLTRLPLNGQNWSMALQPCNADAAYPAQTFALPAGLLVTAPSTGPTPSPSPPPPPPPPPPPSPPSSSSGGSSVSLVTIIVPIITGVAAVCTIAYTGYKFVQKRRLFQRAHASNGSLSASSSAALGLKPQTSGAPCIPDVDCHKDNSSRV